MSLSSAMYSRSFAKECKYSVSNCTFIFRNALENHFDVSPPGGREEWVVIELVM